jgi:two-component system chemotaxis response regulator CheB
VVDDSLVYRSQVREALKGFPDIDLVGAASNGKIGLELLKQKTPDVILLDMEMPEMDGLEMLRSIDDPKVRSKVILFSSSTKLGAEKTLAALALGASEFVAKPGIDGSGTTAQEKLRDLLIGKIEALGGKVQVLSEKPKPVSTVFPEIIWDLFLPKLVVIGSSTGGPNVLEKLFSEIRFPLNCPILVAQHMPPVFTATLAERLSKISGIPGFEGRDGMKVEKNCFYIAPGDFHMTVEMSTDGMVLKLNKDPMRNFVRPAVDFLFESAARMLGSRVLGIVLTGMGADGRDGSVMIKQKSGGVIIQSAETCIVNGMPGAVSSAGAFDRVMSPSEIADFLSERLGARKTSQSA